MSTPLSELTTLRLGGPARELVVATTEAEVLAAAPRADLVLGGGSNLVVADEGVDGVVLRVATRGVVVEGESVTAQAGEDWDALVARTVDEGLAGMEALSGIPGSVGASPVQNVGAYGQDVAQTITAVRALDRSTGRVHDLTPAQCGFGYRHSAFKAEPGRWVVLAVTFGLTRSAYGAPVRYDELASALGVEVGGVVGLADVRAAVLGLRRGKGMVLDAGDPDTRSAGSFFTNPVLTAEQWEDVRARLGQVPGHPGPDGTVKVSAAWLISRSGFAKGHGHGPVGLSTKHVLALTNRGGGTTAQLLALAREVRDGVREATGVTLVNEPVIVGAAL